jgi:tetratricopeptide (TPR) repeat protein
LDKLPRWLIEERAALLISEAWLLVFRFRLGELPTILERIQAMLEKDDSPLSEEQGIILRGEVATVWCCISYWIGQGQLCLENASYALEVTPPEHRSVRGLALTYQIGAYQLVGQREVVYGEVDKVLAEDRRYGGAFSYCIYTSLMQSEWLAGNLQGAEQAAIQLQSLTQPRKLYVSCGLAYEARAVIYYLRNDLEKARQFYVQVSELRYRVNAETLIQCLFGLALTYQAMGVPDQARETSETAFAWAREVGDREMLLKAHSFASRLAMLQGQVPDTTHWAVSLGDTPTGILMTEVPHLTLARVLVAQATPDSPTGHTLRVCSLTEILCPWLCHLPEERKSLPRPGLSGRVRCVQGQEKSQAHPSPSKSGPIAPETFTLHGSVGGDHPLQPDNSCSLFSWKGAKYRLSWATRPASFRQAGPRRILGPALSLAPDQPSNMVSAALTPHGAPSAVRCRTWVPMFFQAPATRSQGNAYLRLRIKAKAQKREDGADVGRCTAVIRPLGSKHALGEPPAKVIRTVTAEPLTEKTGSICVHEDRIGRLMSVSL